MKLRPIIALAFVMGFQSLATNTLADVTAPAYKPPGSPYAAAADEDEEDDEEEEQVNYRDRVREIQQWLNRRDSERKQGADATMPPAEQPVLSQPFPKYFQDSGYDERGFRKLGDDVRLKLRDEEYRPHYRRHSYRPWRRHAHAWHRHFHSRHGWRNRSHPRHGYSAGKHGSHGSKHQHHGAHAHSSGRSKSAGKSRRHR